MSSQMPPRPDDHEAQAALLTAFALDELSGAERAAVDRRLAESAEARREVEETRAVAALLRRAHAADDAVARLPEVRRAVLVAASRPQPRPRTRWAARWLLPAAGIAAALTVAVTAVFMQTQDGIRRADRNVALRQDEAQVQVAKSIQDKSQVAKSIQDMPAAASSSPRSPILRARKEAGPAIANTPHEPGRMPMLREAAPQADVASKDALELGRRIAEQREAYSRITEARMASPREQPLSTFSIDVDTASYANVRRFLLSGRRPPHDAVRIEELLNYFRYDYPQPADDVPFSVTVDAAECPWKPGHRLVRIGLQGCEIDRGGRPAGNLVFLIDVSGSMQAPTKLPLVKQALAMLVEQLTENDRVSLVTYAGNAGLVLPPTTGDQKQTILAAIDSLTPGGSTHGSAGITLAYEQAREHFIPGGSNRVILATDGDLNVGTTSTVALIDLIKEQAAGGTFLTVLGFGEGNLQDDKLEALADNGNGVYAYIDGVREARKVLVEQLTGSTITIAKDVKIQVEFNPAQVASYRLLGYENRALAARDFRDDKKDAGEIGAGHAVTALYEVVLVGDEAASRAGAEPLKYQAQPEAKEPAVVDPDASRELLTVKLRWKRPDSDTSTLLEVPLADRGPAFDAAPADLRFAAAVAAFGMILRESGDRGNATLALVARIAGGALGRDDGGYRAEFLDLVRRAEGLGLGR